MDNLELECSRVWDLWKKGLISHDQVQQKLNGILGKEQDSGLIYQVDRHIRNLVNSQFSLDKKPSNSTKYFEKFQVKYAETLTKIVNWQEYFSANPIIPLDNSIKANMKVRFDNSVDPKTTWLESLLNVDFLISFMLYRTEDAHENQFLADLTKYYNWLLEEVKKRKFEVPSPWDVNPIQRFWDHNKKRIIRPNCENCGSSKIVSNGPNWLCRDCGRQFRKLKRRGS